LNKKHKKYKKPKHGSQGKEKSKPDGLQDIPDDLIAIEKKKIEKKKYIYKKKKEEQNINIIKKNKKPDILKTKKLTHTHIKKTTVSELIRLNKYIANSGVCSRREADKLIVSGAITVNNKIVTAVGTKISPFDNVVFKGKRLSKEKLQYVLLNKPKDFITTMDDPYDRRTVMSLVKKACKERIYPVGRLDRNTTGLLLFTNDGEMAKKLTHPKHKIKKVYHVILDKPITKADMHKIANGIELEDGIINVDSIEYITTEHDKKQIGIEIHSGKNRIVRRIFESLNYKVKKLDRVAFAFLTKKDLPRGRWRFLNEKEISMLKML